MNDGKFMSGKEYNKINDILLIKFVPHHNPPSGFKKQFYNPNFCLMCENNMYNMIFTKNGLETCRHLDESVAKFLINKYGFDEFEYNINGLNVVDDPIEYYKNRGCKYTFLDTLRYEGLQFCTADKANLWDDCGDVVKMVTIPDDAKIRIKGDIMQSDKIILSPLAEKDAVNLVLVFPSLLFKLEENYVNEKFCAKVLSENPDFRTLLMFTKYYTKAIECLARM